MHVTRGRRRGAGGQAMAIFALTGIVLFVIVGLSIDAGMAYLGSDAAERAAAGGALSGVTYLPSDTVAAATAAKQEASRNGFADGDTSNGRNVGVAVTQTGPHRLKVTVTETVYTTFMHIVGFGSVRVSRSAEAEYLPPIRLGQPGYGIGSMLCVNGKDDTGGNNCLGNVNGNNAFYFMREEGWGNHRSEGDAFTPNPDPSVQNNNACGSSGNAACAPNPADTHLLSAVLATENTYTGVPDRGGYNYMVFVPAGRHLNVQVYNPLFAPDWDACRGMSGGCSTPSYHEYDSSFSLGSANKTDYSAIDYSIYKVTNVFQHTGETPVVAESVFYPVDASPMAGGSPTASNCADPPCFFRFDRPGGRTEVDNKPLPATYHSWVDIANYLPSASESALNLSSSVVALPAGRKYLDGGATGQYYRLKVSTLDWQGNPPSGNSGGSLAHKGYAVRLVDTAGVVAACTSSNANCGSTSSGGTCTPSSSGCTPAELSGLDDMCFFTPVVDTSNAAQSFNIPIFQLDASYAGKTIAVNVFDPGDVSGTASMSITIPTYTSSTDNTTLVASRIAPASVLSNLGNQLNTVGGGTPVTPITAGQATIATSNSGPAIYNGNWVHFAVRVPSDWQPPHTGNPTASDYWQLQYGIGGNSIADDTVTLQVGYAGTPVHLLP